MLHLAEQIQCYKVASHKSKNYIKFVNIGSLQASNNIQV